MVTDNKLVSIVTRKYKKFILSNPEDRVKLLRHAFLHYLLFLTCWGLGVLCVGITGCARRFIRIRLGLLVYARVGHLASHTELYLRRRSENNPKEIHIFVSGKPANRQLLKMIKRRVTVLDHPIWEELYGMIRASTKNAKLWLDLPFRHNEYHEFNNIQHQLSFTAEEDKDGQELLKSMGITDDKSYICFFARDQAYLNSINLADQELRTNYHNADIDNYMAAVEHVASCGIRALRMGQVVERKLSSTSHLIIDYANELRSDFGDAYLASHCKFFLGCNSGMMAMAYIFDVPIAFANVAQIRPFPLGQKDLFIPKKIWNIQENRFLTFYEMIKLGNPWRRATDPSKVGFRAVENSPEEIMALTVEMNSRLDGSWIETQEDIELQNRFKELIPSDDDFKDAPSKIGAAYLRENQNLLI